MKSDKIKNPGISSDIDSHGIEIFCEAAKSGKIEIVEAIIEKGIDINALNTNGRNALHYAAEEGRLDIVKHLVKMVLMLILSVKIGSSQLLPLNLRLTEVIFPFTNSF